MELNSADPAFKADPFPFYAELRAERPICQVTLNGMTGWFVTEHETVRGLLLDPRLSSSPLNAGPQTGRVSAHTSPDVDSPFTRQIMRLDAPDHTRLRKLVNKAFTPRRVEALRPRIQEITDDLVTRFPASGRVDFVEAFAQLLPLTVITEILGVDDENRDEFVHWARIVTSNAPEDAELVPEGWRKILAQAHRLIAAKSGNDPETDLLSALVAVRAEDGDRMSSDELVPVIPLLMLAGHATSADMLANGVLALLTHPEQLAALKADPGLIGAAVDEVLRHSTPVEMPMPRFALEDMEIGGVEVAKGDALFLLLAAANHDPAKFASPGEFDIRRDTSGHLAFGHGAHFCVGAPLARLEGEVTFRTLFERLPDLRLDIDPVKISWRMNPHLRGPVELPVAY